MRLSPLRAGVTAAALGTTMTLTGAVSTPAQERHKGTPPTASIAKVGVGKRKIEVPLGTAKSRIRLGLEKLRAEAPGTLAAAA